MGPGFESQRDHHLNLNTTWIHPGGVFLVVAKGIDLPRSSSVRPYALSTLISSALKIERVQVLEMSVQFDFFLCLLDSFHGRDHPLEMLD